LPELLVSIALTLTVLGLGMSLLHQGQTMFRSERATQSAQALARKALNLMATDIRATGSAPATITSGVQPGLLIASAQSLRLVADRKGNGTTDWLGEADANDDVTYSLTNGTVTRHAPNDPDYQNAPVMLASQVRQLGFRYFDRVGNELVPPTGGSLEAAARANVVRIHVLLTVEIAAPGEAAKLVRLESPVTLRYKIFDGH
jgi:type II secretory pathway component PulJ